VIILKISFPAFMALDRGWNEIDDKGKWLDGALIQATFTWE
jgi:hypothetical protein